jgi:uncharacterized SAM-binding protein YcdF (DUF218 family)
MFLFGMADYSRPADLIVVFGARTYADGTPSDALADRVRTECDLYHEGLAPIVVMSGGPGDGAVHETQAMMELAVSLGVPPEAILLEPLGLNTFATARNTAQLMQSRKATRLLAVSHFYHLPRIKLSFARQGIDASTVPARESYVLSKMPLLIAREVAALWVYYVRI